MSSSAATVFVSTPSTPSGSALSSLPSSVSPFNYPSLHRPRGEHPQADDLSDVAVCFNWNDLEADEEQQQLTAFSVTAAAAA